MKPALIVGALVLVAALGALFFLKPASAEHYGNAFKGYAPVEIAALADRPTEYLKKDVTIEGNLGRQCPAKGCWFYLRDAAGKEVKVEMGDTTPNLPQRVGKTAKVEGQLIKYGDKFEFVGTAVEFH